MASDSSKTAQQQRKVPGKPFVKSDPRINRKGRPPIPKDQAELNTLLDEIFGEQIEIPLTDGSKVKMGRLRAMIIKMALSKNVTGGIHLLDRRYGKVKEVVDLQNSDGSFKPETMAPSEILARADALRKQVKDANGD